MADNNAKCIRVVFPDSDEGNNTITFKTQLKELVELSNNLNRTALFISKEPGAKNHFICGLIENNNLLLINPLGISSHKIFYETLAELQREKTIKEIWLSSNSLQKIQYEEEGLVSCGPITLELAIHILTTFTPEELQLFWRDNLKTSQPTTHDASQLSYHGVNINNLLPNILKELGESNHEHVYQIKVCDIREKHFKQLQTLPAEHSKRLSISVENYLSKCKNEAPAQVIFNSLITDKTINNIDVSPEFQLLKNELELQAIDVNVLSHESNETLKLGKNLNPKDLRIEKNSEQIQQMSENRDGISKSKTKNIPEQQKPIPKKPDDNNMKEKDLGEGLYAITDEQKKIGSIYLESFKNGKMVKKDKKKLSHEIMLQLIDKDFDLNDKDTRDLFVALVKDKNVCKKKPSALIKLIEKKQPEITASVLKKCEGNSAFILTILNDANFKAEIAEQIKAAIDPVLQAEKDRKKLSDTAVVHIFNSGQFNEALVKYPDILAKLLFVNEAKELCAHLLINPDHLKWTEINLSKRQVEQFVKLGFESEVYSNYALVKKLKITDYSVCTELQLDAMLNNPQLFVKDEKIKEVLTNHIANNWLKNFDTKMDDFIKFLKIEKVRNAILTPLSSVQILKLCDDNNELLAALFSDRNKEGLIMKRFDELLPELTLDRIELANMVLEMPNVAQKLTLSQLFQLMTLGDKNITDWVYANKADIQFDSRQTKNLFDLNPFFAAKNISQDLIDIEDFFNLLLDNNKQEFVKNLLANDEPKLLEYIGNIYPNIKLLFESKKIFSWLDKYKPSGQQFVFQKNTSRDQSSIMLPRKDDKRKFKNILDSAEKNEINGNIRAAQDEYFAAYTHKKAGKEKLSSEKILATQKNPMTEYAPKDTRNKKDKKDKNQYASVVLGYKLVESCFLNKNYELLFQVLFQGEEVFKRNKKEKDIITRTNDVDASFLHYFKQIEANEAFIILSNQTFDQKLSSIYIDHIHQHFSTTRILESLSIDCLIGSDRLIFEKYVPDVNKKQKVLEAILSSESVNVFSVLKNDLDLLSWANSIMPKKVKNIISIALSDKSLSISYFLRSPVMTDIFETKEIVYYINENPATQKILPLYRHLSEVKVSFELEKRETERAAKQKLNEVELSLTPTQSPPEMKAQLDDNTPMKIGISPSRGGSRAPRAPRAPMAPNNQSEENKPAVKRELPKISAPESAIDDLISKMKKGKPLLKSQTNITGLDDEQVKHIKIASDAANNDVFRWRKFARELDGLINNKAIKTSEIFRTKLDGLLRDYNIVVEKDSDLDKVTQAILSAWNNKINISSSAAKITQSLYKYTDNTSVQNAGCNISTSPKDSSNTHKADEQKTPQQSGTYVTMDDAVSAALKRRRDIEGADDHNDDASQWDRSCGS